jgi:hypothetical protein
MPEKRIIKYFTRYLSAIRIQIIKQRVYKHTELAIPFSLDQAHKHCGVFEYNGTRYMIWKTLNELCGLVTILDTGNNYTGKISTAMIDKKYIELLVATADTPELLKAWFGDNQAPTEYIPIDAKSLEHYLMANRADQRGASGEYLEKLKANLLQAEQIMMVSRSMVAQGHTAVPSWPHKRTESGYGRYYYTGLSVHTATREVRKAALGSHYSYDINASVYAIKLMVIQDIYKEMGLEWWGAYTYTKEYLELKSGIRRRLAGHIRAYPDGEKLVKEALTAIGFGARLQNSSWTDEEGIKFGALTEIIRNPEDRRRFMEDPWVIKFVAEQTKMTKEIADYYIANGDVDAMMMVPNMMTASGKFRRTQVVVYVYQQMERLVMDHLFAGCGEIARIHDCAISLKPLKMSVLNSRCSELSADSYLSVEEDRHGAWYREENDEEVVEHKEFIKMEEARAAAAYGVAVHQPTKVSVERIVKHNGNTGAYGEPISTAVSPFM